MANPVPNVQSEKLASRREDTEPLFRDYFNPTAGLVSVTLDADTTFAKGKTGVSL